MFDARKEHITLHITIFEFESNKILRHSNILKQNIQIVILLFLLLNFNFQ